MSKKENTETGMVITTASSVPDALKALNQKLKELKHIQDSVYKTSGNVTTSNGVKDIKNETNKPELVKAFSGIIARAEAIEKAYDKLAITDYPVVKIDGGTVEEWKADILLRIAIIDHKETYDSLNAIKKEWEELMDKDDRKALLIEKMKNL